jgi:hypothetical protein
MKTLLPAQAETLEQRMDRIAAEAPPLSSRQVALIVGALSPVEYPMAA